ncbi:uncharacterized protein LOC115446298 [Manduca sexta]|uniref:uncharacterized protein LOC115446298 n=1 Tax=Manduca sexta TaxID=7130 RepID=UPI00188F2BF8|nr:uncharacterized protein LOC115446298 [Manduca sexta]
MVLVNLKSVWTKWWFAIVVVMAAMVMQVTTLNGPNVCMVKQKYNITKRVKYRAPMSVRTYEWCFSMPPRCSKWNTEMRDLTRLETEERTAEVAVCCPGYKMRDVSCVPICPNGKTGPRCSKSLHITSDPYSILNHCPQNRWGPNCVNECPRCQHGECSPVTGECHCQRGWQGESCELRVTTTTTTTAATPEAPLITYTSTKTSSMPTPSTTTVSTTTKFKPKNLDQTSTKGEPIEAKKITYDVLKHRVATNKDFTTNTTPKTIIVSIIPTSVSYATFKKIALTTASFIAQKTNTTMKSYNKSTEGFTKPMSTYIYTTPATVKTMATTTIRNTKLDEILVKDIPSQEATLKDSSSKEINKTNSMIEKDYVKNLTLRLSLHLTLYRRLIKTLLTNAIVSTTPVTIKSNPVHKHITDRKNITKIATKQTTKVVVEKKSNHTKMLTNYKVTTEDPTDEETFHILTEPEHITAVMGEKEAGRTSIDLISVISIAGGVMMAVITVAVVIVMIERCRRPRYEDVRKINDIRMQVMIDGSDAPPPYVRSIFHTPLPEPPMSEKCHYQPISTLDRNLKQFMRPVVVQTISPIMLENFRGILECHYDHLPRRSHDFVPMEARCSLTPSMSDCGELHHIQRTIRDSTLESLKCEAKLDVIDTTTSEPLYAEIPCWRPPSEHAIEILTLNGEAVTEL